MSDKRIGQICTVIFDELDRQHETGEIDGNGHWDREWGRVDGEPVWSKVAAAVIAVLDHRAGPTLFLADGREVPVSAVEALEKLDRAWPGATLPQARAAIAAAVLGIDRLRDVLGRGRQ